MSTNFNPTTFKYFDLAFKYGTDRNWFLKNEELYLEHVKKPMLNFISLLWAEIDDDLSGIEISPKKILRPVKPINKLVPGQNAVKHYINTNFAEKENSRFEWNPGIFLQLSAEEDENYVIVGLDMVSGRQLKLLRESFVNDHSRIGAIFKNKKFQSRWGELQGERYSRFPRLFEESQNGAEYLWHKQCYFMREFTRKEVLHPEFSTSLVKDLKLAMPFLSWVRETVGTVGPYLGSSKSAAAELNDW